MAEEYKKSTSGWRTSLKNVAAEDSPENNAKNGIYSPPMKVISNTIMFVYSLGRRLHQNWARVSNAMQ